MVSSAGSNPSLVVYNRKRMTWITCIIEYVAIVTSSKSSGVTRGPQLRGRRTGWGPDGPGPKNGEEINEYKPRLNTIPLNMRSTHNIDLANPYNAAYRANKGRPIRALCDA